MNCPSTSNDYCHIGSGKRKARNMRDDKEDTKCDMLQLLCRACLCSDRLLQPLRHDSLLRYNAIVNDSQLSHTTISKVCSECGTRLKKVVHFRQRIVECYDILERGDQYSDASYPQRHQIYNNVIIDIQPQNNQETKFETVFLHESPINTQAPHYTPNIEKSVVSDMNLTTKVLNNEIKIEPEETTVDPEFIEIKIEPQNLFEEIKIETQDLFESETKDTAMETERLHNSAAEKIKIKSENIHSEEEPKQDVKIEMECMMDSNTCIACLSVNRQLHYVKNIILKQYYVDMLKENQVACDCITLRLCFECLSTLRTSIRFEDQLRHSFKVLHSLSMLDTQDLSSLLVTVGRPPRLRRNIAACVDIQPTQTHAETTHTQMTERSGAATQPDVPADGIENGDLVRRSNLINQKEKVQCNHCSKYFKSKGNLSRHMRVHTGVNTYKFSRCPQEFHVKGDKPHRCSLCSKAFVRKGNLKLHMKTHGLNSEQIGQIDRNEDEKHIKIKYQCSHCTKAYTTQSNLSRHKRLHTGKMPYQCNNCLKSLKNKSSLIKHTRVHTGEKPYKCAVCQKAFSQRVHQRAHMSIHSGERPYWCNLCSKTFTRKTYLNIHLKSHSEETNQSENETKCFQCDQCSKAFSRKESLQKHIRMHTGEKPHQCKYCPKAFSQKGHLLIHMRTHTGERPYQCTYCPKAFPVKGHLNKHILTHQSRIHTHRNE